MSGDKDVEGFAQFLAPLGPRVVLTQATTERALPVKELAQRAARAWADVRVVPDWLGRKARSASRARSTWSAKRCRLSESSPEAVAQY